MLTAFTGVWTGETALFVGGANVELQAVGRLGLADTPGR
jgi:hypothetical protein